MSSAPESTTALMVLPVKCNFDSYARLDAHPHWHLVAEFSPDSKIFTKPHPKYPFYPGKRLQCDKVKFRVAVWELNMKPADYAKIT